MYQKRLPPTQTTQWSKKCRIKSIFIIKKVSQDEQQNQTTTTNINYIQNFMSILKNLNNKVKIASDELKITYTSLEKICDQSIIKLGNIFEKQQSEKFAY